MPTNSRSRLLWTINGVLAALCVAAIVTSIVLGVKVHRSSEQRDDRAAAANVAGQFALRMDNVDGSDFAAYIKRINALLTTKARTKNSEVLDSMKQAYESAKVKGTGKVLLTAVGDYDPDSSTVLVVHDATVESTQGKLEHHYRWTVSMVKVKGRWLVDDFNPVS